MSYFVEGVWHTIITYVVLVGTQKPDHTEAPKHFPSCGKGGEN